MKKVLDSAPCDFKNANSCAFGDKKSEQILREFGYKLGRYDVLGKSAESALDSANRAINNNNMRVNKVFLFFLENVADLAQDSANRRIYKQIQNLTQNGVEIIVFLKNSVEAKFGIDFWRKFGIVYLLKD